MVQQFYDDERLNIVENFDEVEQPYTCEQWGEFAQENIPMIFTDGTPQWDFFLWDIFNLDCSSGTIIIDHKMRIRNVLDYFPSTSVIDIINGLLIELELSIADINGDDLINILDIVNLANLILFQDDIIELGDVNQDEIVNILDIIFIVNIILED